MTYTGAFSQKTLNILKASLPFIPSGMQRMVSNFVKIEEFNIMFQNLNESLDTTISACEFTQNDSNHSFQAKDLISAIKPYLDDKEKELIDMALNMMNAFQIYNMYKSLPDAFLPQSNFFEQNMNSESKNDFNQKSDFEFKNDFSQNSDFEFKNDFGQNSDFESQNDFGQNADFKQKDDIHQNENNNRSNSQNQANTNFNSINPNNINIETLKNLLTPSQRAMFETYSGLLNNQNSGAKNKS